MISASEIIERKTTAEIKSEIKGQLTVNSERKRIWKINSRQETYSKMDHELLPKIKSNKIWRACRMNRIRKIQHLRKTAKFRYCTARTNRLPYPPDKFVAYNAHYLSVWHWHGSKYFSNWFLHHTWLNSICQRIIPEISSAVVTKLVWSRTATLRLRVDNICTCFKFWHRWKVTLPVLLRSTFIDGFIMSMFTAERNINPLPSPPVPISVVQETRSSAEANRSIFDEMKRLGHS